MYHSRKFIYTCACGSINRFFFRKRTLTNWALEFEKWAPTVTMICYKGTPDVRKNIQRKQIKHRDFQVLLTTFDYIIKDRPVLSKIKWQYMIIDEGHRMKNTQSKLNLVLRQFYFARYRLILTGTPLQASTLNIIIYIKNVYIYILTLCLLIE